MMPDWDGYWCDECEEWGHPAPGTDDWDAFAYEVTEKGKAAIEEASRVQAAIQESLERHE